MITPNIMSITITDLELIADNLRRNAYPEGWGIGYAPTRSFARRFMDDITHVDRDILWRYIDRTLSRMAPEPQVVIDWDGANNHLFMVRLELASTDTDHHTAYTSPISQSELFTILSIAVNAGHRLYDVNGDSVFKPSNRWR